MKKALGNIKRSIWLYPVVYSVMSLLVAIFIALLDSRAWIDIEQIVPRVFFTSTDVATTVLGAIAGSLLTMTTFTFSTTMVVLTLYSSQFSPSTVENFLANRKTMRVLGIFMGGFVYSVCSLLFIRDMLPNHVVISSSVGVIYSMACVAYFALFVNHVGTFIQANNLINRLYAEAIQQIKEYKNLMDTGTILEEIDCEELGIVVRLKSKKTGYIQLVDHRGICNASQGIAGTVVFEKVIGQFITEGTEIFSVYSSEEINLSEGDTYRLLDSVTIGIQRTELQDFSYSIQKIVEIALRAISPGVNDPNTASHCIKILGVLLSRIADLSNGYLVMDNDEKGSAVVFEAIDFEKVLYFTFYQLVHYGREDVSVMLSTFKAMRYALQNATEENKRTLAGFAEYIWERMDDKLKEGLDFRMLKHEKDEVQVLLRTQEADKEVDISTRVGTRELLSAQEAGKEAISGDGVS